MSLNLVGLRFASETGEVWWSPSNITIPHTRVVVLPSAGSTFQRLIECVFCVILAQGGDPSMVRWRQNCMRMHLKSCFETGCITPFHSICRLPEHAFNKTLKCTSCTGEYHNSCMGYSDVRRGPPNFTCFRCKPQPNQV